MLSKIEDSFKNWLLHQYGLESIPGLAQGTYLLKILFLFLTHQESVFKLTACGHKLLSLTLVNENHNESAESFITDIKILMYNVVFKAIFLF